MPLNFPSTPTLNQSYTFGGRSWKYNGTAWELVPQGLLTISITDDTTTNDTRYPLFEDVTSGSVTATNVSSTKLTFNPSTGTLSATIFSSLSDITNKNNIKTIDSPIEKVNLIDGVTFNWNDNDVPSMGVIAQQVENVFPELITDINGKKTVNYNGLVALLIECIKENSKEIANLKSIINS